MITAGFKVIDNNEKIIEMTNAIAILPSKNTANLFRDIATIVDF